MSIYSSQKPNTWVCANSLIWLKGNRFPNYFVYFVIFWVVVVVDFYPQHEIQWNQKDILYGHLLKKILSFNCWDTPKMGNFHRQLNQTVKRHCHAAVGSGFTESFVKTFSIFSYFSDVPFWADVYFKFMQLGLFLLFVIESMRLARITIQVHASMWSAGKTWQYAPSSIKPRQHKISNEKWIMFNGIFQNTVDCFYLHRST